MTSASLPVVLLALRVPTPTFRTLPAVMGRLAFRTARDVRALGLAAFCLLVACAGEGDRASSGLDPEAGTIELGRQLTGDFYAGDLEPLWERMTADMRAAAGGSVGELRGFREKVAELAGEELEVLHEEVHHEGDLHVYRRIVRFDGTPEVMVVQWGFDDSGAVADFSIRPTEPAASVAYETMTELHLPFEGEWYVTAGGRTVEQNHHSLDYANRFAYDMVSAEEFDRSGPRPRNEDFATWGQPILAPADGIVAALGDGVPDNAPGEINEDPRVRIGNFVSIDHGNGEFSVLGHLMRGSVRVAVGEQVRRGDVVGLAGNSGNSDGPHLHYNLQDRAEPNRGKGLPGQFRDFFLDGHWVDRGEPVQGQRIRRRRPSPGPADHYQEGGSPEELRAFPGAHSPTIPTNLRTSPTNAESSKGLPTNADSGSPRVSRIVSSSVYPEM